MRSLVVAMSLLFVTVPAFADLQPFEASVTQTGDLGAATVYQKYWTGVKADVSSNCLGACGSNGVGCDASDPEQPVCKLTYSAKGANGYRGYSDNLFNYADADSGTVFNASFEYQSGAGLPNHIGYFAWVTGAVNVGDTSAWNAPILDCAGSNGSACIGQASSNSSRATQNTPLGTIDRIGGFSAIPVPRAADLDGDGNAYTRGGALGTFQIAWDAVTSTGRNPGAQPLGYDVYYAKSPGLCGTPPVETAFTFLRTVTAARAEVDYSEVGLSSPSETACVTFALRLRFGSTSDGKIIVSRYLSANGQQFGTAELADVYDLAARFIGRGRVEVVWKTSLEDGVQAFRVLRAMRSDGVFQPVATVPAKGTASSYSLIDTPTAPSGPVAAAGLFYRLEALDMDNSATSYGPVKASLPTQDRPITVQKPAVKKHR